jgi:dephospho-CoA kinase
VWVVVTDKKTRTERIQKRNPKLTVNDIQRRIDMQLNDAEYTKYADQVIYNNDSIKELETVVIGMIGMIGMIEDLE